MSDEAFWYEAGWATLRRQILNLAMTQSGELLDVIGAGAEESDLYPHIADFHQSVGKAIAGCIQLGRIGLWNFALSLWIDADALQKRLLGDLPALRGEPSARRPDGRPVEILPAQALRKSLEYYLEDMRRRHCPNRLGVWHRLNKISRRLSESSEDNPSAGGNRCASRHFWAVHEHLRQHYPDDHNLPRTYEGIEAYFLEFCPDCRDRLIDPDAIGAAEVEDFMQDIELDPIPWLADCLEGLQRQAELYEVISVLFRLGPAAYTSLSAFCKARSLGKRDLEKRRQAAIDWLRECLEQRIRRQSTGGESLWT